MFNFCIAYVEYILTLANLTDILFQKGVFDNYELNRRSKKQLKVLFAGKDKAKKNRLVSISCGRVSY